jgi:hypothetical protein
MKLRRRIGYPNTVFLASGHYTTLLYTQFLRTVVPSKPFMAFPPDYIETESLQFFRNAFGRPRPTLPHAIYNIIQTPIRLFSKIYNAIW